MIPSECAKAGPRVTVRDAVAYATPVEMVSVSPRYTSWISCDRPNRARGVMRCRSQAVLSVSEVVDGFRGPRSKGGPRRFLRARVKTNTLKTGSRKRSVPGERLTQMASRKRRFWSLRGDWLMLEVYGKICL